MMRCEGIASKNSDSTHSARRILFLAPLCFPVTGSEAIVNAKLVMAFLAAGWDVDILSCTAEDFKYPNHDSDFWEPIRRVTKTFSFRHGWNMPHLFEHLYAIYQTGYNLHGIAWSGKAVHIGKKMLVKKEYDFIMSRCHASHLAALVLSRWSHVPWIANWNDPFPPVKYPPPYGQGSSARISLWMSRYFHALAKHADWHTFCSERLRQYMCGYLPDNVIKKSSVIPHIALSKLRRKNLESRSNSEFTLCHTGIVTSPRDPSVFLEGVRLFLDRNPDRPQAIVKFIGKQSDDMCLQLKKFRLENVVSFEEPRPYLETLCKISNADIAVLIEAKLDEGIFLPSKIVDYIQIGKPILAVSPIKGTLSDLISHNGGGVLADCHSSKAVEKALCILYKLWKQNNLQKELSSSRLFRLLDEETIVRKYNELFEKLQ